MENFKPLGQDGQNEKNEKLKKEAQRVLRLLEDMEKMDKITKLSEEEEAELGILLEADEELDKIPENITLDDNTRTKILEEKIKEKKESLKREIARLTGEESTKEDE